MVKEGLGKPTKRLVDEAKRSQTTRLCDIPYDDREEIERKLVEGGHRVGCDDGRNGSASHRSLAVDHHRDVPGRPCFQVGTSVAFVKIKQCYPDV